MINVFYKISTREFLSIRSQSNRPDREALSIAQEKDFLKQRTNGNVVDVGVIQVDVDGVPSHKDIIIEPDLTVTFVPPDARPDYRAQYAAARNDAERIAIIAEALQFT